MSYQTGRNFVGESQNTLDISSRRNLPGRGWVYAAYCRSCHQHQTFSHTTLASGTGAICRYCSVPRPEHESLADAQRKDRAEAVHMEAERQRLSLAEQKALDKKAAEQREYQRVQRLYRAAYTEQSIKRGNMNFVEQMPLDKFMRMQDYYREDFCLKCGVPEETIRALRA
jgi:hypothetical protein